MCKRQATRQLEQYALDRRRRNEFCVSLCFYSCLIRTVSPSRHMANKQQSPFLTLSSSGCSPAPFSRTSLPRFACSSATFSFGRTSARLLLELFLPTLHFCADFLRIQLALKLRKQLGFLLFDMVLDAFSQDRIFRII